MELPIVPPRQGTLRAVRLLFGLDLRCEPDSTSDKPTEEQSCTTNHASAPPWTALLARSFSS